MIKTALFNLFYGIKRLINTYVIPFKYISERYPDSFISRIRETHQGRLAKANEVIYIFWTGLNDLPENRIKGINSLKEESGVEVQLITAENLPLYILSDHPLHSAYSFLSLVHRADYLRCYFMLHYGGGYSDIKPCLRSWKRAFQKLNRDPDKWCLGYRELGPGGVPKINGTLGNDLRSHFYFLIGNGAYIFKSHSPLCVEWMKELNSRLDLLSDQLRTNPGNIYGDNENYPVAWSYLLGQIFHPLNLKFNRKIIYDDSIKPQLNNYR